MGENEGLMQPPGGVILPNGLLPNTGPVKQVLDSERWLKAEETTAELIACIQPNLPSEERRNAVADYVQRLIMKCFPCQVFTFGSVPLKTYLPDGDIDLTAFSNSPNLKDTWANQVRDILETEEKNENAEFRVKEVQYIQAEVKLIKCLVENIVVDISFNQLGGLCTLCFLEEVDHLISQNHLFKRSIILIKAWCYYESRVLGAHHGLISTYALETLVLYIFHVFNNSFTGPLEVLYRFLEFFSNFDWDNFCVSLWGPVPIASLPDVTAEPPRKDHGELLLSRLFLDACSSMYAVFPGGQENQGQQFLSKHFNVIDPLRVNNNLGRSVSKGNFFRIRSAFAFGAKRLARLLDCPKDDIVYEVNQFFTNSWNRHGSGKRPDAPNKDLLHSGLSTPDSSGGYESLKNGSNAKKASGNISKWDTENDRTGSYNIPSQHGNDPSLKVYGNLKSSRALHQAIKDSSPKVHIDKGQRTIEPDFFVNDIPGRFLFARTRSSPELTDGSVGFSPQGRRDTEPEGGKNQITRPETNNKTIQVSEKQDNYGARFLNSYQHDSGLGISGNGPPFISRAQIMEEEEQDLVNMMASNTLHGANGHMHVPMNLATGHFPFPFSPSNLASMGYGNRNNGMVSPDMHFIDPSFPHMQFPQGFVPPQIAQYFPGIELNSNAEERIEPNSEHFVKVEMNSEDRELGQKQDNVSPKGSLPDNRNCEMLQSRNPQKFTKENRGLMREVHPHQDNGNECLDDRTTASRVSSSGHSNSLKSRTSSEGSWDESLAKVSRSTKEKRGKKSALTEPYSSYEKAKNGSEHCIQPVEDNEVWNMPSTMGAGMAERNSALQSVGSFHGTTQHIHGYELNQTSRSDPVIHMGPVVLGHGSRQRAMDNSRVVFYPTGPPVPFLTMLPVYNVPPDSGNSETSASHLSGEKGLDSSESCQHFDSSDKLHNIEELHTDPPKIASFVGSPNDKKPDILNSDFASHYQNLLFGRFCQNPHSNGGPVAYPSPVAVPPMYLQGRVPFDGPGRPLSANINQFSQLMGGYGPRLIPVAPFQSASNRPSPVYHHYVEEIPRQHNGTGTFLPNPNLSPRERNPSGPRRGNYNYERNDGHGDVERSWNSPKSRAPGKNHFRGQNEKSNSMVERLNPSDTYRGDSVSSYQAQNTQLGSNSSQTTTGTPRMAYSMFDLQAMNPNRVSSNGPRGPSPVMLYPFDHNVNFDIDTEQLEFGSFGQVDSPSSIEQRQLDERNRPMRAFDEQRIHGVSAQRSSPDQPSSPGFQGLMAQMNYQLKEEDFPPLAFSNQVVYNGCGRS